MSLSLDGLMRRRRACSEATMFLEFHFQGSDVLLGCWQVSRSFTMLLDAGRQSEVFSVLGVYVCRTWRERAPATDRPRERTALRCMRFVRAGGAGRQQQTCVG